MKTKDKDDISNITGSKAQGISHAQIKKTQSKMSERDEGRNPVILELDEAQWPIFSEGFKKNYPDVADADLPYTKRITDDYFGRIEKKYGHRRSEMRKTISAFHTWKA